MTESHTKNGLISKFDIVALKVRGLQRQNCVIAKDPKERPVVLDIFGVERPVLQMHTTDCLARKDLLCDQIAPIVQKYYDEYCDKVEEEMEKKVENLPPTQENKNREDSAKLNDMLWFDIQEDE